MLKNCIIWSISLSLIGGTSVALADKDDLAAVEEKLEASWQKVQTLSARVKLETKAQPFLGSIDTETKGTLLHKKKDGKQMFRQDLSTLRKSPTSSEMFDESQQILADGEFIYLLSETDGLYKGMKKLQKGSSVFVGGKTVLDELRRENKVQLAPDGVVDGQDVYVIEAIPYGGKVQQITFYSFDKATGFLLKREAGAPDGSFGTVLTFSDVKINVPVDDSKFVFDPPKGVIIRDRTKEKQSWRDR